MFRGGGTQLANQTFASPTFTGTSTFPGGTVISSAGAFVGGTSASVKSGDSSFVGTQDNIAGLANANFAAPGGAFLGSGAIAAWSSTSVWTGTADTSLSRVSAGLLGVGTGGAAEVDGALKAAWYATGAPVTETGATHTVATTTAHLICNRAGDVTVTLPAAASFTGRHLMIRTIQAQTVTSNASNVVPRIGGAAGTAILAASDGAWALLVSDGTNWEIMAGS